MRRHIENRRKTGNGSNFSSRTEKQRGGRKQSYQNRGIWSQHSQGGRPIERQEIRL